MVLLAKDLVQKGSFRWLVNIAKAIETCSQSASTYTGMTADETLIESLCILPASPNEKPIRKHVIVTYMADGSEIHTKPITYCPFCGRKL